MPDNLPELRDIHLPEGVSAFPLGYGWWIILFAIPAAFITYYAIKFIINKSKKHFALSFLARINTGTPSQAATSISEILRRICIYKYPSAASLSGDDWILFLNSKSKTKLGKGAANLLKNAPYMPPSTDRTNAENLIELKRFCQKWIGENL